MWVLKVVMQMRIKNKVSYQCSYIMLMWLTTESHVIGSFSC